MRLFSSKKRSKEADQWEALAQNERQKASNAAQQAAGFRQRLDSGTSTDRECDRYMLRQNEEDRRVGEANARDFEANAKSSRRWW